LTPFQKVPNNNPQPLQSGYRIVFMYKFAPTG